MEPLRIAVALPHLGVYGGIRRFLELGNAWSSRGHAVALLLPEGAAAREPWIPFQGRVGALSELAPGTADVFLSPDPVLFTGQDAPGALRVFYSVLEGAPGESNAAKRADLLLANSAGLARYWRRRGFDVVPAPGGVNPSMFRPPVPDTRRERAREGGPVRALVYGRLSRRRKGSRVAVRALERAARASRIPVEVTLFDARPVPGEGRRGELPRPPDLPHRWVHDPSQEQLAALYGEADIFVSAERRAGWCNTAAEAMACGAAVVCTRSGTEDFAHDGDTARVSAAPWAWLLARAVARLLRDPESRFAMAERGRKRIVEFTWEQTAARIESAIAARLGVRETGKGGIREAALTQDAR